VSGAITARPQPEVRVAGASDEEAGAVVAAVQQFIRDTAVPAAPAVVEPPLSPWKRAALLEGVSRQPDQ
jgi:hypothetical protein